VLLDLAPPERLPVCRAELASVRNLVIALLHAESDVLVARDVARAHPTGLEPSWHGRIRTLRDRLLAHAERYDNVHDTGAMSAEESADTLAPLLDP
jgi:RNase adaptor protein for sRNA GlmZ degradation